MPEGERSSKMLAHRAYLQKYDQFIPTTAERFF
jgi:hypothetical protein